MLSRWLRFVYKAPEDWADMRVQVEISATRALDAEREIVRLRSEVAEWKAKYMELSSAALQPREAKQTEPYVAPRVIPQSMRGSQLRNMIYDQALERTLKEQEALNKAG